jgi:hypothetical protein
VHVTINNPTGIAIYHYYTYQQTAIAALSPNGANPFTGPPQPLTVSFTLWPPSIMGSGTYQDQLELRFCLDPQCASPVAGSPIVIAINYTVTGNSVSNATYQVTPSAALTVETADTAASAAAKISVYTNQLPPYTTYLIGQSRVNGIVANGSWQVSQQGLGANGTLTINLKSPMSLGAGVYADTITVLVCYDQACTKQALGSPWILPVTYTVTATAGVDYSAQMLAVTAIDLAWSATAQKLYAVTTSYSSPYPSSIIDIDPSTATVTRSLSLTGSPIALSLSDDGSYAYVGFSDQGVVNRIALATMSLNLVIPTPTDPVYGATYAGEVLAVPGSPHSVVVSLYTFATGLTDFDSRGVYVYDDAVQRPNTFFTPDASTRVMTLGFGANSSTLYAYDGNLAQLSTASLTASGLTQLSEAAGVGISGNVYYLNNALYADDGSVTNPSTGAKVADFLQPLSVLQPQIALDGSLNRAYFFYEELLDPAPLWTFATYDLQTLAVHAKTRVSGCSALQSGVSGAGRLVRFGSNGLAVNCREGIEIIAGAFVSN